MGRRRKPVTAFNKLDLTARQVQQGSFEDMTALVANTEVISTSTAMLTHLGLQEPDDANAALAALFTSQPSTISAL